MRRGGGVLKLMAVCIMWGGDHVPQSTGSGNNGGLFSLSVLAGRLISLFSSNMGGGGVAARLWMRRVWCLKRAGDAINNSRPVEVAANSGEVVGSPLLSCKQQEPSFIGSPNDGQPRESLLLIIFSCFCPPPICIKLKKNSAKHPTLQLVLFITSSTALPPLVGVLP